MEMEKMKQKKKIDTASKSDIQVKQPVLLRSSIGLFRTKSGKVRSTAPNECRTYGATKSSVKPIRKINIVKRKFLTNMYVKEWFKKKFYPNQVLLINMEMRNGKHDSFIIRANATSFKFMNGLYVIDNELKYDHLATGLYALDYHQDCALPIKRNIPINEIAKTLEASGISEVEYAVNPSTLERFLVAKIAEGIMKGQQIDEYLKQMKLILIITMVSSVIMLALFVIKTGMLKGIAGQIPGLG